MRQLSFSGPSMDGQRLLLIDEDGNQFELPVDDRLVSVVTRQHGATQREEAAPARAKRGPSPREIQERIRHGASVEDVAASAGVDVAHVQRYAYPVISEREHITEMAKAALVTCGSERVSLDHAVTEHLREQKLPTQVQWDSWRQADGRWTVVMAYLNNGAATVATFVFNPHDQSVLASDEAARMFIAAPVRKPVQPQPTKQFQRPSERGVSTSQASSQSANSSHPAARAKQRRDADPRPVVPAAPTRAAEPAPSANAPQTAELRPEPPSSPAPHWEELLFGSPKADEPAAPEHSVETGDRSLAAEDRSASEGVQQ